jgi:GntR family transcriptional repressor for pyruvate dehydrogenase complex
MDILEKFEAVKIETPVDKIIKQIRDSIIAGQVKPGERLPSERQLSEKFGVGRTYVRDAIKKLEFFGILKTNPQSGTVVAGIDISAMEGLFTNVIKMGNYDFASLVETRVLLEVFATRQAALKRSKDDLKQLEIALDNYRIKVEAGNPGVQEDFNFHLKVAEASHNQVIKSLMLIIIPDIIQTYRRLNICGDGRFYKSLDEHNAIFECIASKNADRAEKSMRHHLKDILEFSTANKTLN